MLDRDALEADGLRAFVVFAEHLNFTTAAAELLISQPALHVKIRKLGVALGLDLYERVGRHLVLTEAGTRLAAFAREQGRQVDDFLADLLPQDAPLTIAAGRSALRWVIGDGIRRLVAANRTLRVHTADRDAALRHVTSGRADLAVVGWRAPESGLCSLRLAEYPQTLVVPEGHQLSRRTELSLSDLHGLDLVLPPPGRPHRETLDEHLLRVGATSTVVAEVDGWDLLVHFAALGLGATVVNGCVPAPPGTRAVPISDLPAVTYWATWRAARERLVTRTLRVLAPGGT